MSKTAQSPLGQRGQIQKYSETVNVFQKVL